MPRKLRMEQEGGLYHVINRGNYRRDLFETEGAAEAFLRTLFEAAKRWRWRVHGYVLMKNHFHLAIETLDPTLGEGMHWLQSTLATRFNRFRSESGHLFQGRYKAMPLEDSAALARVVDYIHLNPVRAKVVAAEGVVDYRWSSLRALLKETRAACLCAEVWLSARGGWADDAVGLTAYTDYLVALARDEAEWERAGVIGLAKGWAIGTDGWKKALAKEHAQLRLHSSMAAPERKELREAAWNASLAEGLQSINKLEAGLQTKPRKQAWKLDLALKLRNESGASIAWIAHRLNLGKATTVRGYLHLWSRTKN